MGIKDLTIVSPGYELIRFNPQVTPAPDEWQFDHIIPKDKGGTNSFSNCQIASRKFNRQKWNK